MIKEPLKELDEELGGFGKFQKFVFFLVCLTPVVTGISVVNHVFIGFAVPYRCEIPGCDVGDSHGDLNFQADFLNFTTPFIYSTNSFSSCQMYERKNNSINASTCNLDDFEPGVVEDCFEFVYDQSLFRDTLVTEFDLTCDRAWMQSLGGSLYMFGMPFGAVLLGYFSDSFGRKRGLVVSLLVLSIGELGSAFSLNFYMYLALKFISGAGSIATFQNSIIPALEVVSTDYRTFTGMFIKIPFAVGETSVAAFAYFIRGWRWLQFTLTIPSVFLLSYWWIMPESIRWLISKGRYSEAKALIEKAASMNNVVVSDEVYKTLFTDENLSHKSVSNNNECNKMKKRSALDLFRSPRLRKRTLILIFSWIAITHNFYGLSSSSANFVGNIFINFVAIMAVEVPSYVIAYLILDRLGRKGTLVLLQLTGGASCFIASMINQEYTLAIIILSIGGKFCVAAAFAVIYIYTIEIFPTQYRSLGLGTCSMSARIGGIVAPFTAGMGIYYKPLPLIVFGVISMMCGSLLILLPETLGSELPQTLEESENYGLDQNICYFKCCLKQRTDSAKEEETELSI